MHEQVISFDIDGVLANFVRGFTRIAHRLFGTPVCDAQAQESWFFEEYPQLGLTKEQCDFANGPIWGELKASPLFWQELDPLNPSVMRRINAIKNKIFITNRMGVDAEGQTERFLQMWGIEHPTVIVAAKKAPIAVEYHVVAHVDDYYPNCMEIRNALSARRYVALLYTPYNREYHDTFKTFGGEVVLSVDQFIDECEKRKYVVY